MGTALGQALGIDLGLDLGIDLAPRAVLTPTDIIALAERKMWVRADQGITLNGTRVSGWANIWGNGNYVQATASTQPLYNATAFNGRAAIQNDTGTRFMAATLSSAIATGSRMYMWAYVRVDTPTINKFIAACGTSSSNRLLLASMTAGSTNWRIASASAGTVVSVDTGIPQDTSRHLVETGLTTGGINQWVLSGSPLSATALGVTGADVTSMALFSANTGSGSGPVSSIAEVVIMVGEPTEQQKVNMRRYFGNYYGTI